MNWDRLLFSFRGRIDQKPFLVATGLLVSLSFRLAPLSLLLPSVLVTLFALLWFIPGSVCQAALSVKRLHDMNWSGWWILPGFVAAAANLALDASSSLKAHVFGIPTDLILLPIYLLGLLVALAISFSCFFLRGTRGPNRFGPDPRADNRLRPSASPAVRSGSATRTGTAT